MKSELKSNTVSVTQPTDKLQLLIQMCIKIKSYLDLHYKPESMSSLGSSPLKVASDIETLEEVDENIVRDTRNNDLTEAELESFTMVKSAESRTNHGLSRGGIFQCYRAGRKDSMMDGEENRFEGGPLSDRVRRMDHQVNKDLSSVITSSPEHQSGETLIEQT